MAVDAVAGFVFVVSMTTKTGKQQCQVVVFKNKKILKTILLNMNLFGSFDLDRVHRMLYIPYQWDLHTYVGEVDYKGQMCSKIKLQGEYPVLTAYDERDDVLYALVHDKGSMYIYTFNFTSGLQHVERKIYETFRPNIFLVSCHSLVLIGPKGGVIFERNPPGNVTPIAGRNAVAGVIFEHTGHEATSP